MKHHNAIRAAPVAAIAPGYGHHHTDNRGREGRSQSLLRAERCPHLANSKPRRVDLSCILFPYSLDRSIVWVSTRP
ncbi:MAG: hypothetical protein AB4042_18465 [Leptolyngbyaceae cyanobacterium]